MLAGQPALSNDVAFPRAIPLYVGKRVLRKLTGARPTMLFTQTVQCSGCAVVALYTDCTVHDDPFSSDFCTVLKINRLKKQMTPAIRGRECYKMPCRTWTSGAVRNMNGLWVPLKLDRYT